MLHYIRKLIKIYCWKTLILLNPLHISSFSDIVIKININVYWIINKFNVIHFFFVILLMFVMEKRDFPANFTSQKFIKNLVWCLLNQNYIEWNFIFIMKSHFPTNLCHVYSKINFPHKSLSLSHCKFVYPRNYEFHWQRIVGLCVCCMNCMNFIPITNLKKWFILLLLLIFFLYSCFAGMMWCN